MRRVVFRCTEDTYGMPDPRVPDGTVMIWVQDGVAEVGRYEEPRPPEAPWPAFSHPINAAELRADALAAVRRVARKSELHGPCLHFVCPPELAARAVWGG
jgi:hypothetical protein